MTSTGCQTFGPQRLGLFISLLLLACGCTPDQPLPYAAALPLPVKACDLLAPADLEAILGAPVVLPRPRELTRNGRRLSLCLYYRPQKKISVGIYVIPHGRNVSGADALALRESELQEALGSGYRPTPIPEVGEHASWEAVPQQLTIAEGPYLIIIGMVSPDLEGPASLALSLQVAARLLEMLQLQQ